MTSAWWRCINGCGISFVSELRVVDMTPFYRMGDVLSFGPLGQNLSQFQTNCALAHTQRGVPELWKPPARLNYPKPFGCGYAALSPFVVDGPGPASLRGQRRADYLRVVSRIDAAIGKSGMRPDDGTTGVAVARFEQVGAADFLVFLRAQLRDDEVAFFIEQEITVCVLHDESIAPALGLAGGGLECFP